MTRRASVFGAVFDDNVTLHQSDGGGTKSEKDGRGVRQ